MGCYSFVFAKGKGSEAVYVCGKQAALETSIEIDLGLQVESNTSGAKTILVDSVDLSFKLINGLATRIFRKFPAVTDACKELERLAQKA